MFTSISKLRSSSAMQSRVDQLERFLKKQSPKYSPDMIFPIAVIAISNNAADDYRWVMDARGTHVKSGFINGKNIDLAKIVVLGYDDLSKAARVELVENAVAQALDSSWAWKDGLWPTAETSLTPVNKIPSWPFPTGAEPEAPVKEVAAKPVKEKTPKSKTTTKPPKSVTKSKTKAAPVKPETFKVDRSGDADKTKPAIVSVLGVPLPESNSEHAQRKFKKALLEELSNSQALLATNGAEVVSTKKGQVTVFTIVI